MSLLSHGEHTELHETSGKSPPGCCGASKALLLLLMIVHICRRGVHVMASDQNEAVAAARCRVRGSTARMIVQARRRMADRSALSRERAVHYRVAAAHGVPVIVLTSGGEQHDEWHTVLCGMIFLAPVVCVARHAGSDDRDTCQRQTHVSRCRDRVARHDCVGCGGDRDEGDA
ncbi:hypothetical protein NSPZN2_130008 [Nitrospira defluvii]|uniref:Uncharacterized protein n=1 Tax=Nitrospira defluvii TaxID=330214 RepID=A0ABN7LAB1_9BACT|nr:hypothetical protein NSPZN2_130008 [Nitrospira defluvii]